MARYVVLNDIVYDVMARMETHDRDNPCLQMLHGKSMDGFVVINNMDYGVMADEKLMLLSTNTPFIPLYDIWNGAMHK
jgi:hypothetical protein